MPFNIPTKQDFLDNRKQAEQDLYSFGHYRQRIFYQVLYHWKSHKKSDPVCGGQQESPWILFVL